MLDGGKEFLGGLIIGAVISKAFGLSDAPALALAILAGAITVGACCFLSRKRNAR